MALEEVLNAYQHVYETFDFTHKKVLVRADLNVPFNANGSIADDYRLKAILPLLERLIAAQATIILATHLGRPQRYEAALSTQQLCEWFKAHGYSPHFHPRLSPVVAPGFYVLENLRFFPGEQTGDPAFARQLAALADIYINDAFALLHRKDTSITLTPLLFPSNKRLLGPLVIDELRHLAPLVHSPQSPYVVLIGGGKVSTKLPLLTALLNKADYLIICPALCFTFLKAQGYEVGESLVENSMLEAALQFLQEAQHTKTHVIVPTDIWAMSNPPRGTFRDVSSKHLVRTDLGISLGTQSLQELIPILQKARTLFINAAMYLPTIPGSEDRFIQLLHLIEKEASRAYSVIGGGDSVALAQQYGLTHLFDYVSTGGGATLAYISNEPLPGLQPFLLDI